jgi:hypothetical protein
LTLIINSLHQRTTILALEPRPLVKGKTRMAYNGWIAITVGLPFLSLQNSFPPKKLEPPKRPPEDESKTDSVGEFDF